MSEHTDSRRFVTEVYSRRAIERAIEECNLCDIDKQILEMRYVEHKSMDFIADSLGFSYSNAVRRHKLALAKLAISLQNQ